jgi:hypothetical protein
MAKKHSTLLEITRPDDTDYSRCFVESIYVEDPIVTHYDDEMERLNGSKKLTLVQLKNNKTKSFASEIPGAPKLMETHEMVLADGTCHLIRAVVSTSLSQKFCFAETPYIGSTVYIDQFTVLHDKPDTDSTTRASILVLKMKWNHERDIAPPGGKQRLYFDREAVDRAATGRIVITVNQNMGADESGKPLFAFVERSFGDVAKGVGFYFEDNIRIAQRKYLLERTRRVLVANCPCQCRCFGLRKCVVLLVPPSEIDYRDLFRSVRRYGLAGSNEVENFRQLSQREKRGALFWWYSINVLGFKEKKQVPSCLYRAIRVFYPNKTPESSPLKTCMLFPDK